MKKLKYVKLFESFLNEELSPETMQSFQQKAGAEASKGDLDSTRRLNQYNSAAKHVSPLVKKAIKELEDLLKQYKYSNEFHWKPEDTSFRVVLDDLGGLNSNEDFSGQALINIFVTNSKELMMSNQLFQRINIQKDTYGIAFKDYSEYAAMLRNQQENKDNKDRANELNQLWHDVSSDRKIINKLKELIILIQENEIVAKEPRSAKSFWKNAWGEM